KRCHADIDLEKDHADNQQSNCAKRHLMRARQDWLSLLLFGGCFVLDLAPAKETPAAEEEIAGEGDEGVGKAVVQIDRPFIADQSHLGQQTAGDDAGRSEWRQ